MIEQAREELQSTGSLSLPTRKKLWLALGEVKKNAEYWNRYLQKVEELYVG